MFTASTPRLTRQLWMRSSAIGAGLLAAGTALNAALDGRLSLTSQAFVYVLCVVIAARYALPVVSALVALLAVAALNFFFVDPRYTLAVEHPEHAFALVGMLVLAVVISRLAADLRHEAEQATIHAQRAQQLQTLATELADTRTVDDVHKVAQRHQLNWTPPDGEPPDHPSTAEALLTQALRRVQARESQRLAEADAEQQRVRSAFLAAISHDLRTPLSTIVGAATALRLQQDKLAPSDRDQMLESIVQEAQYLSNVADNTLQLVRLSAPDGGLRTEWESIEEIVGAALARVRPLDPDRRIQAEVATDLPLIRGNAILLVQLLVNLLDNALRHAQGAIRLKAQTWHERQIRVTIEDQGPAVVSGLPSGGALPAGTRETAGLGLSLCHAIAKAHGATLFVDSGRPDGGTVVTLMLNTAAPDPAPMTPCP
jgi:K+-sensing histidine kinase KdpD